MTCFNLVPLLLQPPPVRVVRREPSIHQDFGKCLCSVLVLDENDDLVEVDLVQQLQQSLGLQALLNVHVVLVHGVQGQLELVFDVDDQGLFLRGAREEGALGVIGLHC
jgi:hypothetical protein